MQKSIVLAALVAAVALSACGKKEEAAPVEVNTTIVAESAADVASAADAANAAVVAADAAVAT